MHDNARLQFWSHWLFGVTVLTVAFGLFLMLAPTWTRQGFSLLFHAEAGRLDGLGSEATRYISFIHAALGAAITGWGIVLMAVARGPFRRGTREGWLAIAASLTAWFLPDVAVSLWWGYWQNVVLDGVFAVLYAAPLVGTWNLQRTAPATG